MNIWSSGTIDPANPFDQCTFQNGIDRFLLISNSQVLTIRGANFPTAPLYNNVWKNNDAGRITFRDATGAYAGATYENDLYNRIDWVVTQPGLWTGAVSSNWNTPENWDDLTVPVSSTNVTIPAGLYMMPIISSGTAYCNNLTVAGTMTIRSAILQVGGNMAIGGTLGMNNASGQLIVQGDVDWNSGSAAAFTENSVFHVYGHWNFNAGANAQLANGSVFFKGSSAKFIRSYSANCSFWNLVTNKTGMYSTEFSDVSTQPLTVNGSLTTEINSKFIVSSNQTLTIKGNIIGNGVFQCNAGRVKLNGASQTITPNGSDYFNNLDFNQSGTVSILNTYSNILYIRGGLTILSGIFDAGGNTINIRGGWSNTPGSAAFVEGSSQVIFNGTLGQAIYTNEDFNILEINKPSGEIFINGTSVTCNSYNWTAGLIKLANSGVFTANDLADNGVFGQYDLQSGAVVNLHQDIYQYVDINGSLHIEDGSAINIYGGNGWSQWATGANTTLFMSGGVLDFKDQGININTMSPYSLTTDITGGTIRTTGGFFCNRSDFAPADGTLELYGTNDATLEVYSGSVKNLKINKTLTASPLSNTVNLLSNISIRGLTVESGTLKATNKMITTADDINVNYGGTLWLENAAQLLIMGEKALIVNEGGLLKALGETGSKPVITRNGITSNSGPICNF
ncbi:MAG: hypothetical protein NTW16_14530 [Bacteroidetes bacterium]|nr:hypothetical protein [Bacteroidota bacterium]